MIQDLKILPIFAFSVLIQFFYGCNSRFGTKLQRERTGERPAIFSVHRIESVRSDSLLFVSPISNKMRTEREKHPAYLRPFYLYVLRDPFTREIRYVGITSNPKKRERDHRTSLAPAIHNDAILRWKEILKTKNTFPVFELIKKFESYELAHSMEKKLILSLSDSIFNVAPAKPQYNG